MTDQNHHYRILRKIFTSVEWVEILCIRSVRFRFWFWTLFSILKKVSQFTWNFYSSLESVSPTSRIKLNTKKRSLYPINFAHLVWFCYLLLMCSIFRGYGACHYVFGVKLDLGYWKKCRTSAIFNPLFEERLHPMHRDTFNNRELFFGELSPFVGSSFDDPLWCPNLTIKH